MIKLKRVYLDAEEEDGFRILVDRLWPRGISKEKARKAFDHVPERFALFAKKYQQELSFEEEKTRAVSELIQLMKEHPVITFVYGAKNEHQNHAVVLKEFIEKEVYK